MRRWFEILLIMFAVAVVQSGAQASPVTSPSAPISIISQGTDHTSIDSELPLYAVTTSSSSSQLLNVENVAAKGRSNSIEDFIHLHCEQRMAMQSAWPTCRNLVVACCISERTVDHYVFALRKIII